MSEIENEIIGIDEDTQNGKYLSFPLGNTTYAIEIKYVTEIVGIQSITEMPQLLSFIKGIINLRGKIIPVMDVRLRFNKEPVDYNERTCIIVIQVDEVSLGLIVDNVSEVLEITDANIIIPPDIAESTDNKFVKAIGKIENNVNLILNCKNLINNDDYQKIEICLDD